MTTRYRRHPDLRLATLEDRGVALHLGARRYFTVNETGAVLLEALASPATLDALVARLVADYAVAEPEARATCEAFLRRCVDASLVLAEDA